MLVFDDAHLMDDATTDLVRRLRADVHHRPWLVVASYRADDRADDRETAVPGTAMLALDPLAPEAAGALLAAITDRSPLKAHAGRARGASPRQPAVPARLAVAALDDGAVGDLPDSIEEIVAARIDRLSPGLRRLLRSAAVLGMVIDQPVFESVLQADGILELTSFDNLRHLREFIVEVDGQRVQFRHHLAREAAYEGLPFRRRAALHAHTADAIERAAGGDPEDHADLLSLHSFHGGRYEAAWRYSRIAAERARSQYANVEAAECYERALESAKRLGRGAGLDIGPVSEALGDACFELGDLDRAERALRVALQQKGLAAVDLARLRMKVALVHESTGRYSSALRWISMGRTLVAGEDGAADRLVAGQLTARYARVLHLQGRNREAVRWATRAMQDAERAGDDQTLAQALECLDWAEVALGRMAPEPRSTRSLAIYVESGDLCGQGRIHNSLGIRAYFTGHWPQALEHYRLAAGAYRRAGREWSAATADANVAEVLADQGHLDEAHDMLAAAMRVWRSVGASSEVAFGQYQLGRVAARAGRFEEAFRRFEEARSFSLAAGETAELIVVDSFVAEARMLAGQQAEALALADDALERALAERGLPAAVPLLHRVRAGVLAQQGRRGDACAALRESLRTARQRGAQHDIALVLAQLLASGCEGRADDAVAWAAERDELWARLGMAPAGPSETYSADSLRRRSAQTSSAG